MINVYTRNIIRFIVLILIQVLILDNIIIAGMASPFLFVLFILLLPFETPGWLVLFAAFFLGLTVDIFNDTLGIHTFSTVFMGFLRPFVLKLFAPREGYEPGTYPRIHYFGFNWFLKYAVILVSAHHIWYFFLEAFGFQDFGQTMAKAVLSIFFSLVLIILSQFFMYRKV